MTVEFVLQVTRDEHNRLIGSVRAGPGFSARSFSGTLELMRVFKELVPAAQVEAAADRGHLPKE